MYLHLHIHRAYQSITLVAFREQLLVIQLRKVSLAQHNHKLEDSSFHLPYGRMQFLNVPNNAPSAASRRIKQTETAGTPLTSEEESVHTLGRPEPTQASGQTILMRF